jgi:fucose permease
VIEDTAATGLVLRIFIARQAGAIPEFGIAASAATQAPRHEAGLDYNTLRIRAIRLVGGRRTEFTGELMLPAASTRRAVFGFFLSGILVAFLGAILPVWGHHLKSEYLTVGNYFLSLNAGILLATQVAVRVLPRRGIRIALVAGSAIACGGFLVLAAIPEVASPLWRMAGVFILGLAAGLINTALLHMVAPLYRHDPASTMNLAGMFFGLGCLLTAVLVAGTFYVYTSASILILLAVVPGFFAGIYARWRFDTPLVPPEPSLRRVLEEFKNPAAVLLSLLLFFQFGNELAVAGWVALFLVQRLGISPEASLKMLSLYWASLLIGRVAIQWVIARVHHGKLLMGSLLSAMFGCGILWATNNLFGAGVGLLLIGGGFAAVYPLVLEKIGDRFPSYHPGFFNSIFSLALTGGLLAPWTASLSAHFWGIRTVMFLPLLGAIAVFILANSIWLYARMTGSSATRGNAR